MNRIEAIFATGKKAIMPFVVAGSPSIEDTESAIIEMANAGAAIVEIGIPFSDPIADGPVIAKSMHESLTKGTTPAHVVGLVKRLRIRVEIGLVAMVSYSIVKRSDWKSFIDRFAEAGIDGFIIPDIDEKDAVDVGAYCRSIGISFSMLVAPTTPIDRVEQLAALSSGFLYILARTGLTGEQKEMPDLAPRLEEIRQVTTLPLAVGFGISNAAHVKCILSCADAAIVGSALVRRMEESDAPADAAKQFVSEIS
tara:strand:+ start:363 stop:1121 length:759 start_codon:yes stop_codon:yes gene_type:complete